MKGQHLSHMFYITSEINKLAQQRLKELGLSELVITHGFILELLYKNNGKMAMKDLAVGISRTKSTVTQLVEKLVKHDLVTKKRCELDKRYFYVELTPKAFEYKEALQVITHDLALILYKDISEDELSDCSIVLSKMAINLN